MRTIFHLSDVHFGPPHDPDAADGARRLIEERLPDLVVVSGDLTQRAKATQFRAARAWLDALPVPWIAVPGNHDVPMYRVFERALSPFGAWREHFQDELEPTWSDDELFVLGVNTAFQWTVRDGRITRGALRRLDERLAKAPADRARLVVAHHHLIPPPRFDSLRVTENAREALALFAHHGVELVLSGHLHQSWIGSSEEYYPSGRAPVLLVHSGTSMSRRGRGWERRRMSGNYLMIEGDRITIDHLLWHPPGQHFLAWSRHQFPRRGSLPWALPEQRPEQSSGQRLERETERLEHETERASPTESGTSLSPAGPPAVQEASGT